ncbi:MAG: hypothetical protein PHV59_04530 [Victivallales bacterium]|nr:hypothetical protein [Victivallales bacterium]
MFKKLIILLSLTTIAVCSVRADWVWWPGFPESTVNDSPGFRFGLFSGGNGWVHNWEAGIFSASTRKTGIQTALLFNSGENSAVQLSMVYNNSDESRCQLSLCNVGIDIGGIQLGLINIADKRSVQIGIINIITSKTRTWRVLPIFNMK